MMSTQFSFFNNFTDNNNVYVFTDPAAILTCTDTIEVPDIFGEVEKALAQGQFVAGYLSYELGYGFMGIPYTNSSGFPLLYLGVFDQPEIVPYSDHIKNIAEKDFTVSNPYYSLSRKDYYEIFDKIKDHLSRGNTYQVNYTFKYNFDLSGSQDSFFKTLLSRQNAPYASFFKSDEWSILSLSPELFFERNGPLVTARPMKGTMARGGSPDEDNENRTRLEMSEKDRAENIMIVDLIRNDLGIISETGSVSPKKLFDIEPYETLFQMTSTINATVKEGLSWKCFFEGMFPSGSVTGAPKKRTMEIIKENEPSPRNIYTGSMGYITPSGRSVFNVAIRSVLINNLDGKAEMGIGSGLVYDSSSEKEYDECILKGLFLTELENVQKFCLIETILWEKTGYFLLSLHLSRLKESADRFGFDCDTDTVLSELTDHSGSFHSGTCYRVRLTLEASGKCHISSSEMDIGNITPVKIALSDKRTDKNNIFLYHKTSNRKFYDDEFSAYREKGYFDVIFMNEQGEVTEGAISNIMTKKNDSYFTPPVSCGILNGTYRRSLFSEGSFPIKEKVLHMEDLKNADELFIMNSVRKMLPAELDH